MVTVTRRTRVPQPDAARRQPAPLRGALGGAFTAAGAGLVVTAMGV